MSATERLRFRVFWIQQRVSPEFYHAGSNSFRTQGHTPKAATVRSGRVSVVR